MATDPEFAPSVTVVIAGFARNSTFTVPHLVTNLSHAVKEAGYRLRQVLVVLTADFENSLIRETASLALKSSELSADVLNVNLIDVNDLAMSDSILYDLAARNGNPYPKSPHSLKNTVHFLNVLGLSINFLKKGSDYILFCRSDLLLLDPARLAAELGRPHAATFVLPKWHRWGGYNDRIAFFKYGGSNLYLNRVKKATAYLSAGSNLHGERFLAHCLSEEEVSNSLSSRLLRTRDNLMIVSEDFSAPTVIRHTQTKIRKFTERLR